MQHLGQSRPLHRLLRADRAWLGSSAPTNVPSQGLMLIEVEDEVPAANGQRVGFGQRMLRRARTGKKSLVLSP
jgi:hypothetical protein